LPDLVIMALTSDHTTATPRPSNPTGRAAMVADNDLALAAS